MSGTNVKTTVLVVVIALVLPAMGYSQKSVPMTYEGAEGIWVPEWMYKGIISDLEEFDVIRLQYKELESLADLRLSRIDDLKIAMELSEKSEERAVQALDVAIEDRQEAENKLEAWYRHPAFLIGLGIVLTVGIEVGAVAVFGGFD